MNELFVILLIVCVVSIILRKPRSSVIPVPEPYIRPEIIEDSTHLKSDLAATQEELAKLNQELGQYQSKLRDMAIQAVSDLEQFEELQEKFDKLQHQNKSSQVRTGSIGEALLPLHEEFPCDPKTLRFLGAPIDYISFSYDTDTITFIEVKTGESQLNENQRMVKSMVERGRVEFKVVRLNEKGVKVK